MQDLHSYFMSKKNKIKKLKIEKNVMPTTAELSQALTKDSTTPFKFIQFKNDDNGNLILFYQDPVYMNYIWNYFKNMDKNEIKKSSSMS
jgi:hypothetical protein